MKINPKRLIAVLGILAVTESRAQIYATNGPVVQPYAGSAFSGYLDGIGAQTMFVSPSKVVTDTAGNLFVLDIYIGDFAQDTRARVRKITPGGVVSTFAGGAQVTCIDCGTTAPGYGTNVSISLDYTSDVSMAIDQQGTLWLTSVLLSDLFNRQRALLRIETNSYVSVAARFDLPFSSRNGICADSQGNIYYSGQNRIYRMQAGGAPEVFAGSGNIGAIDGNGIFTSFSQPGALASDTADNIYVWDSGNGLIRRISQNRDVVRVAGNSVTGRDTDGVRTNASFKVVNAMCVDGSGNLVLACDTSIRKMSADGAVTTIAGNFTTRGYVEGAGSLARFAGASGVCGFQNMLFIADKSNYRIRDIVFNPVSEPVPDSNLRLSVYSGITLSGIVGRTYQIQSSMDTQVWQTEATFLLTESPHLWFDQRGIGQKKFYRAFLLP